MFDALTGSGSHEADPAGVDRTLVNQPAPEDGPELTPARIQRCLEQGGGIAWNGWRLWTRRLLCFAGEETGDGLTTDPQIVWLQHRSESPMAFVGANDCLARFLFEKITGCPAIECR